MGKNIDLTGKRFGNISVIRFDGYKQFNDGRKRKKYYCKCDCGKEFSVMGGALTSGNTTSCGCKRYKFDNTKHITHGMTKSSLYRVWVNMKDRCNNSNCKAYKNYGGRGIKVCREWNESSEVFMDWAVHNGYRQGLTLDRVDVNGNYEPSNCRWETMKKQANNRRNNATIEFEGESHTVTEWSEIVNIHRDTITYRLKQGWSVKDALTKPVKGR